MRKFFRVYLPFVSNELKRNMAYKGAFYLYMFCSLFASFINYYLWMAIYGSADNATLGGLTRHEMVVYVFMSYIASSLVMISISKTVGKDVVKGNVAMNLIKPMDYRISLVAQSFGTAVYHFLMPGLIVWVILEVYKVRVLHEPVVRIENILLFLVSVFMSFLIYVLFDFCFGMIAFFTTYIFGLQMAKEALLSFLTGQLIPLSFFPGVVQRIFDFLPFSSMVYTPVMIYLGKYEGAELLFVLGRQAVWVVLLYVLGSVIWRQVTKRLVVLGG
ncbi:MAG: ABC-2 family transporter protein [Muribaculaceae bacterium]|nr:ABC-2 family transporter protein [Roseburia sp.]MCM1430008.1 ABC-2 family transporter protein [Muribaculaceae bacterium]MCM1492965.1 ABC-2 family transporter protein [Muribaculaceae bacterium]